MTSFANELGHLTQGIHDIKGTNTIQFIPHSAVLPGCKVTHGCIIVDYHQQKQGPNQTSLTIGGVRIN